MNDKIGLSVQYPVFGHPAKAVDIRAKWFTVLYAEIRKIVNASFLRLYYLPVNRLTHPVYRAQLRFLRKPGAVLHIVTNMHSFLLRARVPNPTVVTCFDTDIKETLPPLCLADRVIVCSAYVRDRLAEELALDREPATIYLAPPPNYGPGEGERRRDQILFVGTEQRRKNVPGLFEIFAKVLARRPAELVKVGPPSAERHRLKKLEEHLGIAGRVVWRDRVSESELLELYRTATVAVVPSLAEGFSMPCVEAMACGCPLVASAVTAIPEIVGTGGTLLPPLDHDAWAEEIVRIIDDESHARSLANRGLERAKVFSAVRSARQTVAVYEELWNSKT